MTSTSFYTSGKSERWIPAVCRNFRSVKLKDIITWNNIENMKSDVYILYM